MESAVFHFPFRGVPVSCEHFGDGHINRTYLVTTDTKDKYILQGMSSIAFHDVPGLMENVIAVTSHIRARNPVPNSALHFIALPDGKYYYIDASGTYWRAYEYVEGMCLQKAESPEDFYQSAVAFGSFQNYLSDFPAETLHETIVNFHHTPDRYRKFRQAIKNDFSGRRHLVEKEIDFYLQREEEAGTLQRMRESGLLPVRVTHNDTKLNNVLLDPKNHTAICVIDLDTVMPGLSAYDFGDSIRFGASTAAEDETDLSKVHLDINLYTAFARGFVSSCPGLTPKEREVLPLGAKIMTLECGMRFLTDYLDGNVYFRTAYPEHNLIRSRTQIRLVEDMEAKWADMEHIIAEIY